MNKRERHLNALTFKPVDRIPLVEWTIRGATMDAWVAQGYPRGVDPKDFFALDSYIYGEGSPIPVSMEMYPMFEPETLELHETYKIWRDRQGIIRKDALTIEHEGFVTRSYISHPVCDKKSFEQMKKRYIAADPGRIVPCYEGRREGTDENTAHTYMAIPFLFWTVRDWVGFENLCVMFYDQPGLVKEMFEFVTDFCIEILKFHPERLALLDLVELKEDMAYKHAPMISPEMFRAFMYPHYVRLISFLKSHGVKVVIVDCDGYPGGLIPHWIEAGVDAMSPVEIAAGNDIEFLQKEYPCFAMLGGVDKRELAKGRRAIYEEVKKIPRRIERGGFIPHVDHAIPFDVTLENYVYYRELLNKVARGEPI